MIIECLDFREMHKKSLIGLAKIKIHDWGLIVKDVKLINTNGRIWVSLPTKEYERDGIVKYYAVMELEDKDDQSELLESILDCLIKKIDIPKPKKESKKSKSSIFSASPSFSRTRSFDPWD
jgi:DNA-binding cell septation regulator SpoVG